MKDYDVTEMFPSNYFWVNSTLEEQERESVVFLGNPAALPLNKWVLARKEVVCK